MVSKIKNTHTQKRNLSVSIFLLLKCVFIKSLSNFDYFLIIVSFVASLARVVCQNFVLTLLVLPCDSCFVSWRSSFVCIWIMRGHLRSFHLHTADRRNNAWHCTSSLIIRRPHCSNGLPSSLSLSTKKLFSLSLFIKYTTKATTLGTARLAS